MEIDPYCQRQNCSPLNVLYIYTSIHRCIHRCIDFVDIAKCSSARGYNYITPRRAVCQRQLGFLVNVQPENVFGDPLSGVCASKPWSISRACKNLRGHAVVQYPLWAEIQSPQKVDLSGFRLTCPIFWITNGLQSPTAGGIVLDRISFRFWIS